MADTVGFELYSPTLGTLDLTASFDSYRYALYGAQFGAATPATTVVNALVGQSLGFEGFNARDDVSFYLGVQPSAVGDASAAADGVAAVERWHRATDAEFRYKPKNGAWSCWPLINDPVRRRGGLTVKAVESPAGGVDVAVDEWNNSWRWVQITLHAHPFALAEDAVSDAVTLTSSVGSLAVTGAGDAPLSLALSGGQLDKCLVYVAPDLPGFSPLTRALMDTGGSTLSRTGQPAFYGTTWRTISGRVATIPASGLPAGGYMVVAHLFNNGSTATVNVPITVTANGVAGSSLAPSFSITGSATYWGGIGGFYLPDATGNVTLTFGTVANVYVDEVFILPTTPDSALWLFDAGSATTASITPAATANEQGSVSPVMFIELDWPVLTSETATIVAASAKVASLTVDATYRPAFLTFATGVDPT